MRPTDDPYGRYRSLSNADRPPEVQRVREFAARLDRRRLIIAGTVAARLEAGEPARLRFVGVDREGLVIAAAGMGDVIGAAAERPTGPAIVDIEDERRIDREHRMQARARLPGFVADAGDGGAGPLGRRHRDGAPV